MTCNLCVHSFLCCGNNFADGACKGYCAQRKSECSGMCDNRCAACGGEKVVRISAPMRRDRDYITMNCNACDGRGIAA